MHGVLEITRLKTGVVRHLNVGIVGAGTAGSASAIFLARQGHQVTVYEKVSDPTPIGAGLVLQPTGQNVLSQLGLLKKIESHAAKLDSLLCTTHQNKPVVELHYTSENANWYGLGVHRGVLFQTLFSAAKNESNISIQCGVEVSSFREEALGVRLISPEGSVINRHDMLLVCNGARSSLRESTAAKHKTKRYPWGALWAVKPFPASVNQRVLRQVVHGNQRLIGLLPTGTSPGDTAVPLVSLFYSVRANEVKRLKDTSLEAWKESVVTDFPESASTVSLIDSWDELLFSEYHDVVMWPWNSQRVVFLGDAAHAMSPQLGQGANLALLDSAALEHCIGSHDGVADALFAYSRQRRSHLSWYQFITRALTPFFQSDAVALGFLRDTFMHPMCKIPFVKRQMLLGMAGVADGVSFSQGAQR
jgi:2-polyprenyl-6-methoxyphenol hydroxylase-like FAD-dependent oxidoreductase